MSDYTRDTMDRLCKMYHGIAREDWTKLLKIMENDNGEIPSLETMVGARRMMECIMDNWSRADGFHTHGSKY